MLRLDFAPVLKYPLVLCGSYLAPLPRLCCSKSLFTLTSLKILQLISENYIIKLPGRHSRALRSALSTSFLPRQPDVTISTFPANFQNGFNYFKSLFTFKNAFPRKTKEDFYSSFKWWHYNAKRI